MESYYYKAACACVSLGDVHADREFKIWRICVSVTTVVAFRTFGMF